MLKSISLSFVAISSLVASEVILAPINVNATKITEVSQNAKVSADLASALSTTIPSIDMNRRSGIANDIYIRGQKRDNISIEVDGTKICGACPNRMDPPISHILASQIDTVEVIEGPYDVETFGTMSGGVKITTKRPTQKFKGEMNFGLGSWGYRKLGLTGSGGNDNVRVLISASKELSQQYKDGDSNTIAQQVDNYAGTNLLLKGVKYKPEYKELQAYEKKSIMAKVFVSTAKNQELRLGVTANRSDNVLYGNSKMDAIYDDSNIYSIAYNIENISNTYKNINLQYYYSEVDHPMSNTYRVASNNPAMDNTSHLKSSMQGLKLKSDFLLGSHKLLLGLDGSKRTWNGDYYNTSTGTPLANSPKSIDNSQTDNIAIFTKVDKLYGDFRFTLGARLDSTKITNATLESNDYSALNANMFTSYKLTDENKIFFGLGQASRVPDARELYFTNSKGKVTGTPDLKQTTNREVDLGYESDNETYKLKIKAFYSMLQNYIYIKKGVAVNAFENIDATVYGAELSATYYATDDMTLDIGVSYKKGEKKEALSGQSDKDLADIAPLRANIALNYEYANRSTATIELQASDKWSSYDSDNGEQELASWSVINLKAKHHFSKNFDFTLGVNNLFDSTYAINNTYVDLTLVVSGTDDVMLMNEPGRYLYTSLDFKF